MVHLIPGPDTVTAADTASELPSVITACPDISSLRFTSAYRSKLFELLGMWLLMSTVAHPNTNGKAERVNRVLEDVLRSYATSFVSWGSFLPFVELALNNAVHTSTGLRQQRSAPACFSPPRRGSAHGAAWSALAGKKLTARLPPWTVGCLINPGAASAVPTPANYAPKQAARPVDNAAVIDFLLQHQAVARYDALQAAVDKQKENADNRGRKHTDSFTTGGRVLLSTTGIMNSTVTNLGARKTCAAL
ncbi:hypothetical protein PC110_g14307 [Phytophthora cactorum]|uniref:Integrase catalytic domain-containing protein n=1 Tax=Phytophthora cactorum TaxID=29920 RepID=A0A329RYD3_9STRA|nr:hypothetical protein PC110_g14307 [Phytophthora cactorum]